MHADLVCNISALSRQGGLVILQDFNVMRCAVSIHIISQRVLFPSASKSRNFCCRIIQRVKSISVKLPRASNRAVDGEGEGENPQIFLTIICESQTN